MSAADDIAGQREGRGSVRAAISRLSHYIRAERFYYSLWAVITIIYVGAFLGVPYLTGKTVDAIATGESDDRVLNYAIALALVGLASGGLRYVSRVFVFNAARQVEYEMRNDLFAHFQRLPQSFYFRWRTGDLMSRCVNDLNSVRLLLGPGLLSVIQTPLLLLGAFGMMLANDWQLALLVIFPYPLFLFIARGFGRGMHQWSIAVQEGLGELSNQLQETISGIAVVKSYAMEPVMERRFSGANQNLFTSHLRLVRVMSAMPAITGLLPMAGMLLVLWIGGNKVAAGRLSTGDFFEFSLLIYQLTFPTFIMGWTFALVQRGAAAMQRIDEVLAVEPSIADRDDVLRVDSLAGEIEFRGLTFHYPGSERQPALVDLNLTVPAGSTLGIVGPVGSGKTTLASVIPRLYEVEDGQLFIDGMEINRIPIETLRSNIAMVPQDSFLFSMSMADNIAFGLPDTDPKRVAEATLRAHLTKDLAELPHGLATLVGERGVMLSGGQRQRTALARALALEPKILILDDTLSSVDAETEEAIQRNLREMFDGRTVVIVSHRISSVRDCDRIIVLDEGNISETGTHKELLLAGGFYSRLARQQALEDELEAVA